jgi:hypothetical protein
LARVESPRLHSHNHITLLWKRTVLCCPPGRDLYVQTAHEQHAAGNLRDAKGPLIHCLSLLRTRWARRARQRGANEPQCMSCTWTRAACVRAVALGCSPTSVRWHIPYFLSLFSILRPTYFAMPPSTHHTASLRLPSASAYRDGASSMLPSSEKVLRLQSGRSVPSWGIPTPTPCPPLSIQCTTTPTSHPATALPVPRPPSASITHPIRANSSAAALRQGRSRAAAGRPTCGHCQL